MLSLQIITNLQEDLDFKADKKGKEGMQSYLTHTPHKNSAGVDASRYYKDQDDVIKRIRSQNFHHQEENYISDKMSEGSLKRARKRKKLSTLAHLLHVMFDKQR